MKLKLGKYVDVIFILFTMSVPQGIIVNFHLPFLNYIGKVQFIFYAIMLIRLLYKNIRLPLIKVILLLIFIISCIFNTLLSQNFFQSIETYIYTVFNILYAYLLYNRYTIKEVINLFFTSLTIVIILSYFICIFLPQYGIYYDVNYDTEVWKGVFTHKNTLGNFITLGILISILFQEHRIRYLNIILGFICLIQANSNTPLIAVIIILITIVIKKSTKKDLSGLIFSLSCIISYLYIRHYNLFNNLLLNFSIKLNDSGRGNIYNILLNLVSEKLVLGYGIGSCWTDGSYTLNKILHGIGFNPNQAHNGYLEFLLNLGCIGLSLYVLIIIVIFLRYDRESYYQYLLITLLNYLFILSIFESTLANFKGFYFILQIYCFLVMKKNERRCAKEIEYD